MKKIWKIHLDNPSLWENLDGYKFYQLGQISKKIKMSQENKEATTSIVSFIDIMAKQQDILTNWKKKIEVLIRKGYLND